MCATRQTAACSFKYSGLGRQRLGSVDVNVMGWLVNGSKIGSHDPTCAVCNDIRRHSIQAVNQLLTTMCSNHNWRSSNRPCNPTSIVNPFSRLWIFLRQKKKLGEDIDRSEAIDKPPVGWRGKDVEEIGSGTKRRVLMRLLGCSTHAIVAHKVGRTSHDALIIITL